MLIERLPAGRQAPSAQFFTLQFDFISFSPIIEPMDIEELNKTQIILLTLLVSFVTSIATGIVTVSLVNQAPPVVTDTIHKVIEKTVERVVPGEQKATIIENTKTIVISDQDFIIDAIEKNSASLIRVFSSEKVEEGEEIIEESTFVGLGVILSTEGKIMADNSYLPEEKDYFVYINDLKLKLNILGNLPGNDITLLEIQLTELEEDLVFKPIDLGNSDILKLGQLVISLSGEISDIALTGIVSNIKRDKFIITEATTDADGNEIEEKYKIITIEIKTNLNSQLPMGLLIDLDGNVIGVKSKSNFYTPINLIKRELDNFSQIIAETLTPETAI